MKKIRVMAIAAAAVMSMSAMALPASAAWVKSSSGYKYSDSSDNYVTGWQTIGGKKYYFNSKGILRTGWLEASNGRKFYITREQGCVKGWKVISGKKYYFSKDGSMKTGWLKTKGGKSYYLDKDGVMVTGWTHPDGIKIDGKLYNFDISGVMLESGEKPAVETSENKSLYDLRKEALENVQKYKAEYDEYWELKEKEFKTRDYYYDSADFLGRFMDEGYNAKVKYSELDYSELRQITEIISDICAETGEKDTVYWNRKDKKDFYKIIYEKCQELGRKYNAAGVAYNDEIADALEKRQTYVELYNKYDKQIKSKKK